MSAAPIPYQTAHPFALLQALERRLQAGANVAAAGGPVTWDGLAFRVRNQWCVAPAGEIREVLPLPGHTRIPGAKPWLMGLANLRGVIVPLIDLAAFLGMAKSPSLPTSRLLLLNSSREPLGFLVDEAAGQRRFSANEQCHDALDEAPAFRDVALGAFERNGTVQLAISLRRLAASEGFAHAGW